MGKSVVLIVMLPVFENYLKWDCLQFSNHSPSPDTIRTA